MSRSSNPQQARTSDTGELFPIRAVSSLTGVNPITLRAWERRYGLIKPVRTPSGHRRFRREEIAVIHEVLDLLSRGIPIGQMRHSLAARPDAKLPGRETAWGGYRRRMISAIARFDEQAVEAAYDEALSLRPIDEVTGRLLLPLLAELGRRWEDSEGSVAEEHFFTTYLRNKLGARLHHRARAGAGPRVLAACAPGERHEIGLLLFALAAHEAGLTPVLLGADTPLGELALAARRGECAAIVLSASTTPAAPVLGVELPALVRKASVPVFVGGIASVRERDAIVAAGATPLGMEIGPAAQRLRSALQAPQRPARTPAPAVQGAGES